MPENLFNDISLCITTPMANEYNSAQKLIIEVLNECERYHFKSVIYIVILDKACNDGTYELLEKYSIREKRLKVVYASENKNVVDAYIRGYKEAIALSCDWILEIDAGYSHLPNEIPRFFDKISASSLGFSGLTIKPDLPSSTISGNPPTLVTITGKS